jgi:hypothetical protein
MTDKFAGCRNIMNNDWGRGVPLEQVSLLGIVILWLGFQCPGVKHEMAKARVAFHAPLSLLDTGGVCGMRIVQDGVEPSTADVSLLPSRGEHSSRTLLPGAF